MSVAPVRAPERRRLTPPLSVAGSSASVEPPDLSWPTRYGRALAAADATVVAGATAVGLVHRFGGVSADVEIEGQPYVLVGAGLALTWMCLLLWEQAYEARVLGVGPDEFKRVARSGVRLGGLVAIVAYVLHVELARGFVAITFPLGTAALLAERYAARKWLHARRRTGRWSHRVLVVGDLREVIEMVRTLRREPYAGLAVVGACLSGGRGADQSSLGMLADDTVPVLGSLHTVPQAVRCARADTVAVTASPAMNAPALRRLAWSLEGTGVALVVAPTLTDVAGPRVHVRPVAGLPLLHVEAPEFTGRRQLLKELVDRCAALTFLVLLAPLLAAVAIAVRLDSPGRALFRQSRVGRHGRPFTLYKFRSMVGGAEQMREALAEKNEQDGLVFKIRCDPRVTRVGSVIRRYSLDELPQLFNVLKGEMSLVGPRPPLPDEVEQYGTDVHRRLLVRPGITGLWQVSGRSDLSWPDAVRLDLYYVENWSMTLDLMILWKTLFTVLRARGAY